MKKSVLLFCLCVVGITSGCAINLPFNNRLGYPTVSEAKKLSNSKIKPVSLEWIPADFPSRIDIQGASGFVGSASQTRMPTGVALSDRIMEALDVSIGLDSSSDSVIAIYVLNAKTKFEYSAGMGNVTPGIDYGWCELEAQFNYNGTIWNEKFVSENKDTSIGSTSQTAPVEKVWDNIALQVAKSIAIKAKLAPEFLDYKHSSNYVEWKSKLLNDLKLAAMAEAKTDEENDRYIRNK